MPVFFLPAFNILSSDETCLNYFKSTVIMFMSGIMIALLIEYSRLHVRLAYLTVMAVGSSPRRIHLGLMVFTGFLSMWVSNSAATAMVCPILKGILEELQEEGIDIYENDDEVEAGKQSAKKDKRPSKLSFCLYTSMAYASSIGGCSTIIGTPTNLALKSTYEGIFLKRKPTEHIEFVNFMGYSIIPSWIILLLTFLSMELIYMGLWNKKNKFNQQIRALNENKSTSKSKIKDKYHELGPVTVHEISVMVLFIVLILLFFLKSPAMFKGWGDLFHVDMTQAVPCAVIVAISFLLPTSYAFFRYCCGSKPLPEKPTTSLSNWKNLQENMPWGLIFLVGGGFALAEGSEKSGLAKTLSDNLKGLRYLPKPVILFIFLIVAIIATAFTANVAMANILLPVLAEISLAIKSHPLYLMMPVGLACSMAFHLPVSTPPNAIVCSFANIKTKDFVSIFFEPKYF